MMSKGTNAPGAPLNKLLRAAPASEALQHGLGCSLYDMRVPGNHPQNLTRRVLDPPERKIASHRSCLAQVTHPQRQAPPPMLEIDYMKSTASIYAALVISAGCVTTSSAVAGPAADSLGVCLSDSTTGKERKDLARWVYIGMSAHPDIQGLSIINDSQREGSDRVIASLVTRLLTENCRAQAKLALEKEGAASFEAAFSSLGRVAMRELMSNQRVNAAFENYAKYLDVNKVASILSNR
jgi:hypothetical protein